MSRLDSFIRRLQAQRACLNAAAAMIADRPGHVFELGLGNGRTFDHLREIFPDRDVYVFERHMAASLANRPDDDKLFMGDFRDSLPRARSQLGAAAMLVHADFGSGDSQADAVTADFLVGVLPGLVRSGALVVSDQPLVLPGSKDLALPQDVAPGRYFMRQVGA